MFKMVGSIQSDDMLKTIGLMGGTFDPIHKGHILSAIELKSRLNLDELRLVPCHIPPHKTSISCNSEQRLAMIKLALASKSQLLVDDREIRRNSKSYSVETLEQIREEIGLGVSLSWIMGTDAFANFDSWYRWTELLDFAHLIVIARPGSTLPDKGVVADLVQEHQCDNVSSLKTNPAGSLIFETLSPYPVSATLVRQALQDTYHHRALNNPLNTDQQACDEDQWNSDKQQVDVKKQCEDKQQCDDSILQSMLTPSVLNYIYKNQLYQR